MQDVDIKYRLGENRDIVIEGVQSEAIPVEKNGDTVFIGENPKLIVDLKNQDNYIEIDGRKIPYHREIKLSKDLLEGKRQEVFRTAVTYYYRQACNTARGIQRAEAYRFQINKAIREVK